MRSEAAPVDVVLKCMVCPNIMPPNRARNSDLTTCSTECQTALRRLRKHQRWLRSCPSCLHPSTPEQREDFKRWRTERGSRKGDKAEGRPPKKRETELEGLLRQARIYLEDERKLEYTSNSTTEGDVIDSEASGRIRELDSLLQKIGKAIDTPVAKLP